ncbi:putative WRKY transcription factor 35 [Hordeum vulgare]|nr:putative WRKY transcription factor 35 [Hordeum vulgare]
MRSVGIVINEPDTSSSRLVRPKTELGLVPVKQEHRAMATDNNEATLKWARDDYSHGEMERQRRALEEIYARCHGREEDGVVILYEGDEEGTVPVCLGDPWQGRSKDGAGRAATMTTTITATATTRTSTSSSACRRRR